MGRDSFAERVERNVQSKVRKTAKKKIKRIHPLSFLIWLLVLAMGIGLGAGAYSYLCRNDRFELLGEKEIVLKLGEESVMYEDRGARVISFGKDVSDGVTVTTSLPLAEGEENVYVVDTTKEGIYTLVYTIDDPRFGEIRRVRVIRVGGEA